MHGTPLTLRNLSDRVAIVALILCGFASLGLWVSVPALGPLRGLALLDYLPRYFAAFALYLGAFLTLSRQRPHPRTPTLVLAFALLFRLPVLHH